MSISQETRHLGTTKNVNPLPHKLSELFNDGVIRVIEKTQAMYGALQSTGGQHAVLEGRDYDEQSYTTRWLSIYVTHR